MKEPSSKIFYQFKIILLGDSGVGKTSLLNRYMSEEFIPNKPCTINADFKMKSMIIDQNSSAQITIWDTCGQEKYLAMTRQYFKDAHGIILMYDIADKRSFYRNASLAILVYSIDNVNSFNNIEAWLNEIKSQANPETKVFLIGNKIDLEDQRKITIEMAQTFSNEHSFNFFVETSAKTGFNAQNVFVEAAKELFLTHLEYKDRASRIGSLAPDQYQPEINTNNIMLDDEEDKPRKKKKCC